MQRLELTWIGKGEGLEVEPRILIHDPSMDYGDPDTGNMLIHGDNLLALKALEQDFAGKTTVGLTAGASTPKPLIDAAEVWLKDIKASSN